MGLQNGFFERHNLLKLIIALSVFALISVGCNGDGDDGGDNDAPVANVQPINNDSDGDGVADDQDNCPGVPNEDQADDDNDGIGNACETTTGSPNILLIIGDDMGTDTSTDLYPGLLDALSNIYGGAVYGTPASMPVIMDRIAQQGVVFQNTWAQQTCSPMRASAITGLFANKTNVGFAGGDLTPHQFNMAQQLLDNGYSTAIFGKWHLGEIGSDSEPCDVGFEIFKGNLGGAVGDFWNYTYHVQSLGQASASTAAVPTVNIDIDGDGVGDYTGGTTYAPVVKVIDTMEWIEEMETNNQDKPWFVWLAFNVPHTPLHLPDDECLDQTTRDELDACGGASCSDAVKVRAMINAMDTVTGVLLNKVEALDPNTVVIFVGDNGTVAGSIDNMYLTTNSRGKTTVYESGIRVPMAIRGPGVLAAEISTEFVHVADLFATVLDLAGINPPDYNYAYNNVSQTIDSDSVSLVPILQGGEDVLVRNQVDDYILSERFTSSPQAAVRNGTYKLICYDRNCSSSEFYNLSADPLEENPLDVDSLTGDDADNYNMLSDVIYNDSYFGR